jgi:hypothetical protein
MGNSRANVPRRVRGASIVALTLGLITASLAVAAEPTDAPQSATWTVKKLRFVYMGFTSRFSCDGLQSKIRDVLLQLGARKSDLQVHQYGCTSDAGKPDPFPSVDGQFTVLAPVTDSAAASPGEVVPAHWTTVKLRLDSSGDPLDHAGQCELLEQIKHSILPLIPTRNLVFSSNCVPHQLTIPGAVLSVEVMTPNAPPRADSTAHATGTRAAGNDAKGS